MLPPPSTLSRHTCPEEIRLRWTGTQEGEEACEGANVDGGGGMEGGVVEGMGGWGGRALSALVITPFLFLSHPSSCQKGFEEVYKNAHIPVVNYNVVYLKLSC